jgi:hypothetical protein
VDQRNKAAHMTAKIVIARPTVDRGPPLLAKQQENGGDERAGMADPDQNTKFVMSNAHPTDLFRPTRRCRSRSGRDAASAEPQRHQRRGEAAEPSLPGHASSGRAPSSVMSLSPGSPSLHEGRAGTAGAWYVCLTEGIMGVRQASALFLTFAR